MNKLLIVALLLCSIVLKAQDENVTLGKKFDEITFNWDLESINLNSYTGLLKFCKEKEFRYEVIALMKDVHHYDSVLYSKLKYANRNGSGSREVKKAIKEIEKFEKDFSVKNFIAFLREECNNAKDIENNSNELKNDITSESYDGQVLIVENLLNKYIKHTTKRVDHIREHVHHLNIE